MLHVNLQSWNMAEVSKSKSTSKLALWPTLKKKLGEAKKRKKQKKTNPFALQGLEKFALLMAELQATKSTLVDKTGNSVSAVRYLSRSAQEWTASTIARTASRRKDTASPKSASEIMLLQRTHSKETTAEIEIVDFSESFSFPDLSHGLDSDVVGELRRESDFASDPAEGTRDVAVSEPEREGVGCSGMAETSGLPAKSARLIRNGRLLVLEKGWARSPNSAVALLVALSACVVARVTKIGSSFFELLTIDLVFRWQKGKLYADFLQSLVTRHVVPHLSIRVPRGFALLPLVRRKRPVSELEPTPKPSEVEFEPKPDPSFRLPVPPESSSPLAYPSLPQLRNDAIDINPVGKMPSSTRRLVRKLKAKMSKSPTPGSPDSSHSHSCGASPRRPSKFSFSRRDKEKEVWSDDGWPDDEVFADGASSSKRPGVLGRKCSSRKEKTPDVTPTLRRSPLGRNFYLEGSSGNEISSVLQESRNPAVFDTRGKDFDLWLILGLLVALLFLIVSRLSVIVATSLLFLVLSHAQKETSKYRMPRRDFVARSMLRTGGRMDSLSREEHEFYIRGP